MSVPISALQRNAAAVVRRVAGSGVAEDITDRGRVVAVLSPPPAATGLARLRQAGVVRPATPGSIAEALEAAVAPLPAGLAAALAEQRDSER